MSAVTIRNLVGGTVRSEGWAWTTAQAMCTFFDCKYYTESYRDGTRLDFSFYGQWSGASCSMDSDMINLRTCGTDCSCRSWVRNGETTCFVNK